MAVAFVVGIGAADLAVGVANEHEPDYVMNILYIYLYI